MKRNAGVTIFEMLLVLAISAGMLALGIQFYSVYRSDSDIQQLKANVDLLFQAAARYYKANCSRQWNANGPITGAGTAGTLDPDYSPAPTNPYPVTLATLTSGGFLTTTLPVSPLVNVDANGGYIIQFNQSTQNKTQALASGGTAVIGTIVTWRIQISVNLISATAQQYAAALGADCLSNVAGNVVTPCVVSINPSQQITGNYAVFERLPSAAAPGIVSDMWGTNPTLNQFKQMYTTYPVLYLTGVPSAPQYYLCGS